MKDITNRYQRGIITSFLSILISFLLYFIFNIYLGILFVPFRFTYLLDYFLILKLIWPILIINGFTFFIIGFKKSTILKNKIQLIIFFLILNICLWFLFIITINLLIPREFDPNVISFNNK